MAPPRHNDLAAVGSGRGSRFSMTDERRLLCVSRRLARFVRGMCSSALSGSAFVAAEQALELADNAARDGVLAFLKRF